MPERLSPYRVSRQPNRAARRRAARGVLTALVIGLLASTADPPWAQGLVVFDPTNYQQNLLTALRSLEQINNQLRQLQNQAQMVLRMDQNLQRLGTTISPDLQRSLADIQSRLREGEGLALRYRDTESSYERLFPHQLTATLSSDDALRNARTRWEEEHASLKRAALLQGQIVDSIDSDTRLLNNAMAGSRNAAGGLEVAQAGNELTALHVKQSLQMQGLLAAQSRADTMTRARDLATEDEARQRFKSFVGSGNGYTRSQ